MAAIAALLIVATISVLVVRVAAIALSLTGLSRDVARLQAQSAFTGAGFTTNESESVVADPVRRRIIRTLMLLGNVGFTGVIATLIISFLSAESAGQGLRNFVIILIGLAALWWATRLKVFNNWIDRVIQRWLENAGVVYAMDYGRLLRVRSGYTVSQIEVHEGDWLEGKPLDESRPRDEGVVVLGIERPDGTYLGLPSSKTAPEPGDRITVYGTEDALRQISRRESDKTGEKEHEEAKQEARDLKAKELRQDRQREASDEAGESPEDEPRAKSDADSAGVEAPPETPAPVDSSDGDRDTEQQRPAGESDADRRSGHSGR